MSRNTRTVVSATAILLSASSILPVQAPRAADDLPHLAGAELSPLVVTPQRRTQTVDESLSSVTVIDRGSLDRQQPRDVADALSGRAGLSIASNGPFGKTTSAFMRGTNSDHALVLLDGVRLNTATGGAGSLQFLPAEEVDRIEVARGPRTSLYGSDALGGVIQAFTRQGAYDSEPQFRQFFGGGSLGTRKAGVGVDGGTANTRYGLSSSYRTTDGINIQDESGDDDADGYDNTTLRGRFTHRLDERGSELFGSVFDARGTTEVDQTTVRETDYRVHALRTGARTRPAPAWESELSVTRAIDENTNRDAGGAFASRFDTRRLQGDWRNEVELGDGLLGFGGDYRSDQVISDLDFEEDRRWNAGAYAQYAHEWDMHRVSGSLRYDDNEQFGDETTGQIAYGVEAAEDLRLRASYGTAFSAPTFNQLYFPGFGNPDLSPETSESIEVGARYTQGAWFADLAVYQTDIDDLIENVVADGFFRPENVAEARIRGVDLEAGLRHADWRVDAGLTYLKPEDRETGADLRRRPRLSGRVDVDRELGASGVGATARFTGHRYDDADNEERLGSFGLLDLRASHGLAPDWTLRAQVRNALDRDYQVIDGFNQPGRTWMVSIHYGD